MILSCTYTDFDGKEKTESRNFNLTETVPKECDFSTEFPTWIIAYCPDTDSWFCTNKRFFYYEYPDEFQCENDAIHYFKDHIDKFVELTQQMHPKKSNSVFLENTGTTHTLYKPGWWRKD